MALRLLALWLLVAVLPTVELVEQTLHVVEHVARGERPDHGAHGAHHEGGPGDEHGCTGLVHLCGLHAQVMAASTATLVVAYEVRGRVAIEAPRSLVDRRSPEPAQRPPIRA